MNQWTRMLTDRLQGANYPELLIKTAVLVEAPLMLFALFARSKWLLIVNTCVLISVFEVLVLSFMWRAIGSDDRLAVLMMGLVLLGIMFGSQVHLWRHLPT